jgi:hypothetical protein
MAQRDRRLAPLHEAYVNVKNCCAAGWASAEAAAAIRELATLSLAFLGEECSSVDLVSQVPGKEYVGYVRNDQPNVVSRPANREFFQCDATFVGSEWDRWRSGQIRPTEFAKAVYTVALAPCLAMELFDRQNKKGPATYFERLIGHLFAKELGRPPKKRATLQVHGETVRLTMDFLFDDSGGPRVHLPVKMSTRERVVQAWAHQRILDGAYGDGSYKGVMVIFSETKLDSRSHQVVEICVPDQWLVYQTLLAEIDRIYYFDPPARYVALTQAHPDVIQIKQFGEFFSEKEVLLGA